MTLKIIILIQIKVHLYYTLEMSPVRWWKSLPTLQNCTGNRETFLVISFPFFFQIYLTHFTYSAFEKKYLVHLLTFIARFDTGFEAHGTDFRDDTPSWPDQSVTCMLSQTSPSSWWNSAAELISVRSDRFRGNGSFAKDPGPEPSWPWPMLWPPVEEDVDGNTRSNQLSSLSTESAPGKAFSAGDPLSSVSESRLFSGSVLSICMDGMEYLFLALWSDMTWVKTERSDVSTSMGPGLAERSGSDLWIEAVLAVLNAAEVVMEDGDLIAEEVCTICPVSFWLPLEVAAGSTKKKLKSNKVSKKDAKTIRGYSYEMQLTWPIGNCNPSSYLY